MFWLKRYIGVFLLCAGIGLAVFSCSSAKDSGKAADSSLDRLAEDVKTLETSLRAEIAGAKRSSLILFVIGLGSGLLAFLFIQHQLKRVRLASGQQPNTVPPKAADKAVSARSKAVKKKPAAAKKSSAAKKPATAQKKPTGPSAD
jgi:uncharacterized protein HemX